MYKTCVFLQPKRFLKAYYFGLFIMLMLVKYNRVLTSNKLMETSIIPKLTTIRKFDWAGITIYF